jgi:trimeric autotransporter adhesin
MRLSNEGHLGLNTTNPSMMLHVHEGGLLVTATGGSPTTPNLGAGTRLIWLPEKGAFRAGSIAGPDWDPASVGDNSWAGGLNSMASGDFSFAMGQTNNATGIASVALGRLNTTTGLGSAALGLANVCTNEGAIALGDGNVVGGHDAVAAGEFNVADGWASIALGQECHSMADNSVTIGYGLPLRV